jgi:hypothetical protein
MMPHRIATAGVLALVALAPVAAAADADGDAPGCKLPADIAQVLPAAASYDQLTPLCRAGTVKLRALVDAAAAWYRAAPNDPMARNWLSQALHNRALSRDHLPLPCAAAPIYVDTGRLTGPTAAQGIVARGHDRAQAGWNHTLFSAPAKADAEAALCLADSVVGRERETAYFRALRILIDLERDAELRDRVRRAATPDGAPPRAGKATDLFMPFVEDYLGLARETQAGELLLVFRDLDGPSAKLEDARQAVVLQIGTYGDESKARTDKTAWLTAHGATEPWFTPPPETRGKRKRKPAGR